MNANTSDVTSAPQATPKWVTAEDEEAYGAELVDLVKRAAKEIMEPELNAFTRQLFSKFAAMGTNSTARATSAEQDASDGTSIDRKTTVSFTGLATSFSRDGVVYIVSTIRRTELGGFYQTSVLKHSWTGWKVGRLRAGQMIYRIEVASQLKSVQEHIDTVRMASTEPENTWEGTKNYQDDLMNELSGGGVSRERPQEMSWTDRRIRF